MGIDNVIKLNKPQDIIVNVQNPQEPQLHEYINPFLILTKHYLFEGNFCKAEELVTFFLPVLTETVIEKITDVILKQFVIKIVSEYREIRCSINEENERLLFDYLNYATEDNAFFIQHKFTLPEFPQLLPKHFVDAHPNAPEIALDFLKHLNLINFTKTMKSGFRYVMDHFVEGLEMKDNENSNCFLNGLVLIVSNIFKRYKEKKIELFYNSENILKLPLSKDTLTKYITVIFNAEANESGILTTILDDEKFRNELERIGNSLVGRDFADLSLNEKLSVIEILQIFVVEMGLLIDIRKRLEEDSNISQTALKEKFHEKQKLEKNYDILNNEIVSLEDGKITTSDGQTLRSILSEKRKELRKLKGELHELNIIYTEMEKKKNFADCILWNKLPNILGRDRKFNIYKLSIGFDFIYLMKPKNAKYATTKKEYSSTFKQNCTVNDELLAKLSPITKMKCEGYEYFYVDNIENLKNIISILNSKGVRERELLKNMSKVLDVAELHFKSYQKGT